MGNPEETIVKVMQTKYAVEIHELLQRLTRIVETPATEDIWREALRLWPKSEDEIEQIVTIMKEPHAFKRIDKTLLWFVRGYIAGVLRQGLGFHPTETQDNGQSG